MHERPRRHFADMRYEGAFRLVWVVGILFESKNVLLQRKGVNEHSCLHSHCCAEDPLQDQCHQLSTQVQLVHLATRSFSYAKGT